MDKAAWKLKIPIDRHGGFINFELKEIGIDSFMACQTFIEKKKWKEAFTLFFNECRIGGDEVSKLTAEFDKNNIIPFMACQKYVTEILSPVEGELKKN